MKSTGAKDPQRKQRDPKTLYLNEARNEDETHTKSRGNPDD